MAEIKVVPGTIQLIRMTDAEYFSDQYKDYISNSKLGLFNADEGGSPEKFKTGFKESYSESFELGTAVHTMLLQKDLFHVADINKPSGKLGVFAEAVYELRQKGLTIEKSIKQGSVQADYYAKSFSQTRIRTAIKNSLEFYLKRIHFESELGKIPIFLSAALKEKYRGCMVNIHSSDIPRVLYPDGLLQAPEYFNEYVILCEVDVVFEDKTIRVKLKGKLDNFTLDHESETVTLNDLKTTSKPIDYFMGNYVKSKENPDEEIWYNGSFQKYRYYRQVGMYLWLLQLALQELFGHKYKSKVNMLVVETVPGYNCKVYPVNGKYIAAGLKEFKELLIKLVEWTAQNPQE